ncbi:MAG: amino acid permease [Clostridia bacterium]|nr:amino acid permease [Clostridia bacterium]
METKETKRTLKKNLGVTSAMAIVVGCVIGAGVFFKPYAIYQETGGAPGMGMLAWIIGGLASIFAALTFAEIAILIPRTGGMIAYLTDVYNEKVGFLAGWMQTLIFYPAFLASYGVTVGNELAAYVGQQYALPIAMASIAILVVFNVLGSKSASRFQIIFTICKLIPLFVLMIFGFILGEGGNPVVTPLVAEDRQSGAVLGSTLLAVLFAFEGWTNVGAIAGEMKNPGRDLPRAIVGGVSIIMLVYIIINIAYIWVIPADELMNISSPAAAVAEKIFGTFGGTLIKIGIIISVIGAANGFLMSGSRVCYQLAEQKTLPFSKTLSKLNSKHVPTNSIILIGILGCLFCIGGTFDMLTNLAVFSCWIFYTLTFAAVMTLRRKHPEIERKYKVPLYPVIPILAIISGVYVILSQIFWSGIEATLLSIGSILATLIGLPVYFLVKKYYKSKEEQ